MHSAYVGSASPVTVRLSRNLVAVAFFCLLGLTVSMAVFSLVSPEELAAILAY
jgi:hypothetical protein